VVFDGTPEQLTDAEAKRLYGLEGEGKVEPSARPSETPADDAVPGGVAAVA
jgi:hypothetical protein